MWSSKRNELRVKYNINDIQRQARFPKGDDLSVKCNNKTQG